MRLSWQRLSGSRKFFGTYSFHATFPYKSTKIYGSAWGSKCVCIFVVGITVLVAISGRPRDYHIMSILSAGDVKFVLFFKFELCLTSLISAHAHKDNITQKVM